MDNLLSSAVRRASTGSISAVRRASFESISWLVEEDIADAAKEWLNIAESGLSDGCSETVTVLLERGAESNYEREQSHILDREAAVWQSGLKTSSLLLLL